MGGNVSRPGATVAGWAVVSNISVLDVVLTNLFMAG